VVWKLVKQQFIPVLAEDVEGHEDFCLRFQPTDTQSLMDDCHQPAALREQRLRRRQPLSQVKLEAQNRLLHANVSCTFKSKK